MLVVQPMLDREVPALSRRAARAARALASARGPTDFVQLTGVNHLLARATTGEIAEYGTLTQRSISPAATLELTSWLDKTLLPRRPEINVDSRNE